MSQAVLIGTFDTKSAELDFVRTALRATGVDVTAIDAGILGEPAVAVDIPAAEVAAAAGAELAELRRAADRNAAATAMTTGAARIAAQFHQQGRLAGIIGIGGSGGTSIAAGAMNVLPIGLPKVLVSTVAAGDVSPYVRSSDIAMMYSVLDIAGLNRLTRQVLHNGAAALAGMMRTPCPVRESEGRRRTIALTMFGVTTPGADAARGWLERAGYEVLVFHANGAGGRTMEKLIREGFIDAVLDLTTTELADEVAGGVLSAGRDRLEAAGELGLPQVVSLGAIEVVNFGPVQSIPRQFAGRRFIPHNPNVTLMRTSARESASIGCLIAAKLNRARGPTAIFVPTTGTSTLSIEGGPFFDAEGDRALVGALTEHLGAAVEVSVHPTSINDPHFAMAMARKLDQFIRQEETSR